MIEATIKSTESRMQKSVEALVRDLSGIRTGRASTALVEQISVDYYGNPTPLNQLATIAVPEARLITIQVWDKEAILSIEKAILKSELGLTPSSDGALIRLPVPPLTQDRRQEFVKLVRKRTEDARVAVRNGRRDGIDEIRNLEKQKEISQDDERRAKDQIQQLTDNCIATVDGVGNQKEAELMEV